MKLYFGNTVTTVTTLMILALSGYIGYTLYNRAEITHWGRRNAVLLFFGLTVCCFAAARDGLDKTIEYAVSRNGAPGFFPLISVPTIVGCIGAALILLAAVATPIVKTQNARQILFYIMSVGTALKIITVEIARIIM